jgi:hypothetical protein
LSEIRANTVSNAAGTGPVTLTKQSAAKAWVNFNGTGTIAARNSLNVSSLTDNGTGDYSFAFSSNFNAADYSAVASCNSLGSVNGSHNSVMVFARSSATNTTPATSGMACCAFHTVNAVNQDVSYYLVNVHGDLA